MDSQGRPPYASANVEERQRTCHAGTSRGYGEAMDARMEEPAVGSPSGRSLRALVVEADPDYAVSVKAIAEAASLDVTVAQSAEEGMEALRGNRFELVVL